eukprot:jgi/Tetstr1/422909/TSEL_013690.t1
MSQLRAEDKALLSAVFDTETGIPYPVKTPRFPIAAPPYTERIRYATFNFRAGYTAENHCYAKETVIAAFREKQGNVRNYLARHYDFRDVGKDAQGRKKGPLPSEDRLAKALNLAEALQQSERAAVDKVVALPLAGTGASPELNATLVRLKQLHKKACGIIKHNTNAVKNLAATQALPGDNVDEGNSPEPPAKQPAKPAAGVPRRCLGRRAGGRSGGGPAARPP